MISQPTLSAACLLLRLLRDRSFPARHRLLAFLCDAPHDLSSLGLDEDGDEEEEDGGESSAPLWLSRAASACSLTRRECAAAGLGALEHLAAMGEGGLQGSMGVARAMRRAVRGAGESAVQQGQASVDEAEVAQQEEKGGVPECQGRGRGEAGGAAGGWQGGFDLTSFGDDDDDDDGVGVGVGGECTEDGRGAVGAGMAIDFDDDDDDDDGAAGAGAGAGAQRRKGSTATTATTATTSAASVRNGGRTSRGGPAHPHPHSHHHHHHHHHHQLLPGILAVEPSSSAGLLLRRVYVAIESGAADGLAHAMLAAQRESRRLRSWLAAGAPHPRQRPPASLPTALEKGNDYGFDNEVEVDVDFSQVDGKSNGRARRRAAGSERVALEAAAARGDIPLALSALHAHFDLGWGSTLGGGSAVSGVGTPLGLLAGDGSPGAALLGAGSMARVQELLISSASAAPAGGAALGRSLLHYALLAHAALFADAGAWDEAADSLAECTRVAQASGDASAAAHALLLGAEIRQARSTSSSSFSSSSSSFSSSSSGVLDVEACDMMLRARAKAGELGLWRQQATASLRLVESAVLESVEASRASPSSSSSSSGGGAGGASESSASAASSAAAGLFLPGPLPILSVPDWLSLDPFTSYRAGGYMLGGLTAGSAVMGGAGLAGAGSALGGGGMGVGGGGSSFFAPAALSPTLTSSTAATAGSGPGREGLGAASLTAITSPTVAGAVALARRHRALADRRPSLGGSGVMTAFGPGSGPGGAGGNGGGAGVGSDGNGGALAGAPGAASVWSVPLPLAWHEVVSLQSAGHESRVRMWDAVAWWSSPLPAMATGAGRRGGGGPAGGVPPASGDAGFMPPVTALLLSDMSAGCARASTLPLPSSSSSSPSPQGSLVRGAGARRPTPTLDLAALLDGIGCDPQQ